KLGDLYVDFEEDTTANENNGLKDFRSRFNLGFSAFPSRYYNNKDETTYSILVHSPVESADFPYMLRTMQDLENLLNNLPLLKEKNITVYYSGGFATKLNEYNTLMHDLRIAGIIAMIGITFFLTWRFRRPDALLYIFIPFFCALTWSFALTHHVIGSLNIITSFLFSVLFGLGVDFGIHLLSRFWEEMQKNNIEDSLYTLLMTAGRSCITAGTTTAITFLLLVFNDFKGFSEFGFIACTGLLLSIVAYFVLMPCLFLIVNYFKIGPPVKKVEPLIHFFDSLIPHSKLIVRISVILLLVSLISSFFFLHFEYDFKKLNARIETASIAKQKMRESVQGGNTNAVILLEDENHLPLLKEKIDEIKKEDGAITAGFFSYADMVPTDYTKKTEIINRIEKLFDSEVFKLLDEEEKKEVDEFQKMFHPQRVTQEQLPAIVEETFFGNKKIPGQLALIKPDSTIELDDGKNAIRFFNEIGSLNVDGKTYYPSSSTLVFAEVIRTMLRDSKRTIPIAFIAVFLILLIDFRKLKETFFVLIPLLSGFLLMFGGMCLFQIKLNFYNIVVLPSMLGLGIDYSVHFYHRYVYEDHHALKIALHKTGSAIFITAMTTIFGFAGLIFANHAGLQSLGILATLGISSCMLTSLLFFPCLIALIEKRHSKKSALTETSK
ncbi:MAG: hypothetical protein COX62_06120, partial [Deltaproteobacteria bacterium CG_4_10_14_0_2_um_filter_43_8]